MKALEYIHVVNGVNREGEGFVTITAKTSDGPYVGQFTPTEMRDLAVTFLEAAEAALSDAAIYRAIRDSELVERPDAFAKALIQLIRDARETDS